MYPPDYATEVWIVNVKDFVELLGSTTEDRKSDPLLLLAPLNSQTPDFRTPDDLIDEHNQYP
jgi:hypothetical protein